MDNYSIKSVAFGGFDKQDVVRYIEKAAEEAAASQKALEEENSSLREQLRSFTEKAAALQEQLNHVTAEKDTLQQNYHQTLTELETLRPLAEKLPNLQQEVDALRPDAEAYIQFRERIGGIECDARKRADDLESATIAQLQQTVQLFREQYQTLMRTFESTSAHVNSELRKVEVNLSQLPRAMDQVGAELNTLAAQLKGTEEA